MANGLRIIPDDNGAAMVIDTSSRMLSSLGRYFLTGARTAGTNQSVTYTIPMMTGNTPVIIPNKACLIQPNDTTNIPIVNFVRGLSASGDKLTVRFYQESGYPPTYIEQIADVNVFEITPAQPQSYGIAFYDSTNFLAITDQTRFGYVVYRATINVNQKYTLPSSIPNIENCVVFARWDNSDYSVWYDRANRQIVAYGAFGNVNGALPVGTITNMQIVIVATGFSPPKPASGYGLIIRNAQGVITFSSKYMPVIYKGGSYNFREYLELDTGNPAKEEYVSASGPALRPMVPLCSLGFQCGDYASQGEDGERPVLYSGFKMRNNQVTTYRAAPAFQNLAYRYTYVRAQAAFNLPILDAADYF